MARKKFYFSWEEREQFKKAVLDAGGEVIQSYPEANLFYLESNNLYFGHDNRNTVTLEVEEIFAEEVVSDLKSKLGLKLEEKLGV